MQPIGNNYNFYEHFYNKGLSSFACLLTVHKNLDKCHQALRNNNLPDEKKVEALAELFDDLFQITPSSRTPIDFCQRLANTYKLLNDSTKKLFKTQLLHSFSKLQSRGDTRYISAYAQFLEPILRDSNDK